MTASPALAPRFGIYVDQWGKSLDQVSDEFLRVEALGFDHAWLSDHLVAPETPLLEAWTLLAVLAERTERIRLGVLVTSNTFRHPTLLLKEAVTVDHISGGRLILGIGTGWEPDEHARYGIGFGSPAERVERLEEAVTIIDLLQTQERTTFDGRYYQVDDATLLPKPIQQPRIPILIAAHRPRMLRVAARHADIWDSYHEMADSPTAGMTTPIDEQLAAVSAAARDAGRDPGSIRRSTWTTGEVLESAAAFEAFATARLDEGFTDVSSLFPETIDWGVLEAIGREVLPRLRERGTATG